MTARVPHKKVMSDADRLAKNARIKATSLATRSRRKEMVCRVREVKLAHNKMTRRQREDLARLFLEAKWLRNSAIAADRLDNAYPTELGGVVEVRLPDGTMDPREFTVIGGQLMQSVMAEMRNNVKALAASKAKSRKVGALRFTSEVSSIDLVQFGSTHKVDRGRGRVKVANIHGWMRAHGLEQLDEVDEVANAKLVSRADGYYLLLTTYTHPRPGLGRATQDFQPGTAVGMDMGVATHVTLSDGSKVDALFCETDRLRGLQRKLSRQVKGSRNYDRTRAIIRREHQKLTRRRDDLANKLVHELLRNERVHIQDENISGWKRRTGTHRYGRRIQGSVLGRVKQMLVGHPRVQVHGRYVATTATCVCGVRTPHDTEERWFTCRSCGYTDDRDLHAAKNMVRLGSAGNPTHPGRMGTPVEVGVRPVATMDLASIVVAGVRLVKQEAVTS